jgi:glycerophosphoryl diester phosphodiesterase
MAAAKGSIAVEFDVMLTSDHHLVVFHDAYLERTTNGSGLISSTPLQRIRSLDAGSWFHRKFHAEKVPLLTEVIQWLIDSGLSANIELKPSGSHSLLLTELVLETLNKMWPASKPLPLLSSSNFDCMSACLHQSSQYPRALLFRHWRNDCVDLALSLQCVAINMNHERLTQKRVMLIQSSGLTVGAYTVNHPDRALLLKQWGVGALFSDDPLLLCGTQEHDA